MAYADLSAFRPSESQYTQPGEYEATQRNVALEKATYLSSMDQFYERIEEEGRQFDLDLAFRQEQQGFAEEAWEAEFEESIRQFDIQAELREEEIDLLADQQAHGQTMDQWGLGFDAIGGIGSIVDWWN